MPTVTLYLTGDQIGTYGRMSGRGNGEDRVVTLDDVEAIGSSSEIFTVQIDQVKSGTTQFENGQFITILNSDGDVVMPRSVIQPDIQQGLGAGDEHLIVKGGSYVIDLAGVPTGPETVQYSHDDEAASSDGDNDGELDFTDFPCFARGTLIETPAGAKCVEDLSAGDLIKTYEGGVSRLLWCGQREVSFDPQVPQERPINFKSGFLGDGLPTVDTVLSPDHRILIEADACDLLFEERTVLAPAKALRRLPRVQQMSGKRKVEYFSLFAERHTILLANGMPVETLYPGEEALKRLTAFERASLLAVCPALRLASIEDAYAPARRMLTVSETHSMVKVLLMQLKHGAEPELKKARYPDLRLVSVRR